MRDEARLRKSDTVWVIWSSLPLSDSLSFESAVLHPSHFLVPVTGPWSPFVLAQVHPWPCWTYETCCVDRHHGASQRTSKGQFGQTSAFHSVSTS